MTSHESGAPANDLFVWDVSNPATPVLASSVGMGGVGSVVDVKVRADGTLGVIAHKAEGITLLDLSNPLRPQIITRFNVQANNTWIEGDYVYAAGGEAAGGGRLSIIDISNPADPQVVADFFGGFSHANDVHVRDGLAFVSHGEAGLFIVDVGNGIAGGSPTNPVEVGQVRITDTGGILPGGGGIELFEGVFGDVYSAWYWPDAGYAFVGEVGRPFEPAVSWLRSRLHVVDVSDLSNPMEVATFGLESHPRQPNPPRTTYGWMRREAFSTWAWWNEGLQAIDVSGELLGELDTHRDGESAPQMSRRGGESSEPDGVGVPSFTMAWSTCRRYATGCIFFRPEF